MGSDNTILSSKGDLSSNYFQSDLENIKSKYILKIIFNNLQRNKYLKIIKYNKKTQNRLDVTFHDYAKYSEEIEIEIIPKKDGFGNFINIQNKDDEACYHIYFNNNFKETTRNYLLENEEVKKITIIIDYLVESFNGLFYYCECIEAMSFKRFYRDNINDMSEMFYGCSSLKKLNLSKFNTENVTKMNSMFSGCSSLKALNLSNFKTDKVTNMKGMFSECMSLQYLDISNFNTNNVTEMSYMFSWCSSLTEIKFV